MVHFKKVGQLPANAVTPASNKSTIFTDELVEELKANPGSWYLVEGGTGQGAAAWLKRINGTQTKNGKEVAKSGPFEYATVKTAKTKKRKNKKGNIIDVAQSDTYVRFVA